MPFKINFESDPDTRLDVYRGLALALMLIALVPGNWLAWATPAAFGHSGAYEIFLFCAGLAIAPNLLAVFRQNGWRAGTVRAAHRVWQAGWRAVGAILIAVALVLLASGQGSEAALAPIDLDGLMTSPSETLLGIVAFTRQFDFFSQMTAYPMILALSPIVIGLAERRLLLAAGSCVALHVAAGAGLGAPAAWRLDPLAWQLPFFAGIAFAAGALKAPGPDKLLIRLAIGVLALSALADPGGALGGLWRGDASTLEAERTLGPIRLIHFAALAYLTSIYGPAALERAAASRIGAAILKGLERTGAQSLVALVALHPAAALAGALLQGSDSSLLSTLAATLLALALLLASVEIALWFQNAPWTRGKQKAQQPAARAQ